MSLTMSNVNACRAPVLCARGASTRANAAAGRALSAPRGLRVSLPSRTSRNVAIAALPQKEGNITREDEPEEYWASKAEQGGNPMKVTGGLSSHLLPSFGASAFHQNVSNGFGLMSDSVQLAED